MVRKAPVCRIIPFSFVDGPGNRAAIFFQGCGFRCLYCHNPETISLCGNCGACVQGCPVGALIMEAGKVQWNPGLCCGCDLCIQECPNYSSPRIKMMDAMEIWNECEAVSPYIEGITVSGGECTQHHELLAELFSLAHRAGKTAFVDTNGQTRFIDMPDLTEAMDMAMLDVKAINDNEHKRLTGSSNETVLENMSYLAKIGKLYEIRTVVAYGLDCAHTVDEASKIIALYPRVRYKLIRFRNKGVRGAMSNDESPSDKMMNELKLLAESNGVRLVEII